MRLSEAENKIKRDLAGRALQPSDALWENIQKELDQKQSKPKIAYLWWKLGSVAAVLCLAFFAYQGFQSRTDRATNLVIDSKPIKTKAFDIKAENLNIQLVHYPVEQIQKTVNRTIQPKENPVLVVETSTQTTEVENTNPGDEAEMLLAIAQQQLKMQNDEKLTAEVNKLIDQAMSETEDAQQKSILKDMKATVLLAEVESEIELEKPPLLKDKIWDALVFNFNQMKNNIVLN
jgi:uncharacterized protein HemX